MAAQVSVLPQSSSSKEGVVPPSCGTLHLAELLLQCWRLAVLGALPALTSVTQQYTGWRPRGPVSQGSGIWNLD